MNRTLARSAAAVLLILTAALTALADGLVPLNLNLPAPAFVGTPKDAPQLPNVDPLSTTPRPPFMVPPDVKNLALGAKITSSDPHASPEVLARLTDGRKDAVDSSLVALRKGAQYAQFDLGSTNEIYAIVIWHAFDTLKVFHGVVVQVADDSAFTVNVRTLFNNDTANVSGRGAGTDREYFETNEGKLIDAKGVRARCVRVYSHGSTDSALNEYTEVEIYGRPPK
jgi:hypothetical protein